jgi:TolB-like protein
VNDSGKAVFLSYASQDAEAAARICTALRAAGIEVWFDQSELRGGDAWDRQIRQQIHDCALFIPIISRQAHERLEGYFRREWRLAIERAGDMAENKAFLVPVAIDATTESDPSIPEKFRELHWTRLPRGETPSAFAERVQRLLSGATTTGRPASPLPGERASARRRYLLRTAMAVAIVGIATYLVVGKPWIAKPSLAAASSKLVMAATTAFKPPPHSIAVLPFTNMSGDKEQEYFSEGLTEELLNSLARLPELQVAARTSSFSFQGQHPDIATVAQKLNVGAVLEGSVRRSGQTVRITTQLVNGTTGFQLWTHTYDRNLGDALKLQTEIANAVASALKVTLLGDVTATIELGGTRNADAFDAHLRASKAYNDANTEQEMRAAIAEYTEAIRLDPNYALAYANRAFALESLALDLSTNPDPATRGATFIKARGDARRAIDLAPDLAEGHLALATVLTDFLEFTGAAREYERALALGPGNARVQRDYSIFAGEMGDAEAALSAINKSVHLDPLSADAHITRGSVLAAAHRFAEALPAFNIAKVLKPHDDYVNGWLGYAYYKVGNLQGARAICEEGPVRFVSGYCLALVYQKLGLHNDAETMLGNLRASLGDRGAVFYAEIYAEWGDTARALDTLELAMRHHDPYLVQLRMRGDLLRKEPRFQAIEKALNFRD